MLEYMIGTTRRNGKSLRYLRIKSDAEIGLTGDLVTFTQTQEDKVSVYEVIGRRSPPRGVRRRALLSVV